LRFLHIQGVEGLQHLHISPILVSKFGELANR
jgi:hypothetical protein